MLYRQIIFMIMLSLGFSLNLQSTAEAQQPSVSSCCNDWWNPGSMHRDRWQSGRMGQGQHQRMLRHRAYMNDGIPEAYRGKRSSIAQTSEMIASGSKLYSEHCASCHGKAGMGDGDAGRELSPPPARLSYFVRMPMAADDYLLWAISEGGIPFGTGMPAFKDMLSTDEIWRMIAYMRAGFPDKP